MNKSTFNLILRWIGVLPAAILTPTVVCILGIAMMLVGELFSGELLTYLRYPEVFAVDHYFTSFVISIFFGYSFVYAGVAMAPQYKKAVAFILFGIIAITLGFLLVASVMLAGFANIWKFALSLLLCIGASGVTAFTTDEDM